MSSSTTIDYLLQGKLALITGCTGGIGQATARLFARSGCSIAVHHSSARSKAKADALVEELTKLAPGVQATGSLAPGSGPRETCRPSARRRSRRSGAYASAKAALHGLIHWLSLRYCKEGILTNGVAPALIEGRGVVDHRDMHMKPTSACQTPR
ncbi:hypothetical protein C8Q80DRAFT_294764 [Daedaleopsis nitida]|nr:hypothetical protein C8Q80DRAFT_294764 [Daedaleopsis nitida]